ncbi:MAG: orotate phosphoribosyltransferase [Nitrospira sp. WS110]|nr:orotate phosphoribosyltransferase [Nitrospira sp. WS110]
MKATCATLALASVIVFAQTGTSLAAWGDGPGCGLGKVVFEKEPKSILLQHLGSTLNVPSQPFALSTGVSGCTNNGMIVKQKQTTMFASLNFENLSQEIAQGRGEHLTSLATLMGVSSDRQAEFFSLAQERYLSLMQTGEVSPTAMLSALQVAMTRQSMMVQAQPNR